MKKLFFSSTLILLGSISAIAQTNNATDLPYKVNYSASFKIGNQKYAKMIVDLWKAWDDNALSRYNYFADSVIGYFADGSVVKGKQKFEASSMQYRNSFSSVKSTIHAYVPLWSEDRKEDIVCMWGGDESTKKDGTVEKNEIHEVWFFNKDGKITMVRQWMSKPSVAD